MSAVKLRSVHASAPVALALVSLVAAAAGCSPAAGVAGPIATLGSTAQPSLVQGADTTAPPGSGSVAPPSGTSTASPGATTAPAASRPPSSRPPSAPASSSSPSATSAGTTVVRAYFLAAAPDGPRLVPVLRSLPRTLGVARAALNALLAGPSATERSASPSLTTAIPTDARLLTIAVDQSSGVATVDLGVEFARGATTAQLLARYAQVVYTLTQFGNVTGVVFEADGESLAAPGDGGTVHRDPVDRSDYRTLVPAIFVDRPAYGAAIGNPARVAGVANVFEATFRVRLIDGAGRTLTDRQVTATCGSGCWGSFDVTLPYAAPAQWGTLRVYNLSARDGSPENVRDEPVWLSPAD